MTRIILSWILLLTWSSWVNAYETLVYRPNTHYKAASKEAVKISQLNYQEEPFELAYKAYVFSGRVNNAYALSAVALKANPNSIVWLKRYAETASWSNHPTEALTAYYSLIIEHRQTDLLDKAIPLAENFRRYDLLVVFYKKYLEQSKNNISFMTKLAYAYDNLGETTKAIQYLNAEYARTHAVALLNTMADIYDAMGNNVGLVDTLNRIDQNHDSDVKSVLMRSEVDVSQSNLEHAYHGLTRLKGSAPWASQAYWETLANVAWLTGHYDTAKQAYHVLWVTHRINNEGLRRLYLLSAQNPPEQLRLAKTAWATYQSPYAFFGIATLAQNKHALGELIRLYQTPLPRKEAASLMATPLYWGVLARLNTMLNHAADARNLLRFQAKPHLSENDFALMYFNFLQYQAGLVTTQSAIPSLQAAMVFYQPLASTSNDWLSAYGSAFNLFHQHRAALLYNSAALNEAPNDIGLIITDANSLSELKAFKSAFHLRCEAWRLIQQYSPDELLGDKHLLAAYADLATMVNPVSLSYPIDLMLADRQAIIEPLLAYSIDHGNIALADILFQMQDQPAIGSALRLALIHNNKMQQHQFITHSFAVLPASESVRAAVNTGDLEMAKQLAYEHLKANPQAETYDTFQSVMRMNADHAEVASEFEQFGALQGQRGLFHGDWYTEGVTFTPYLSAWYAHSNNAGNLAPRSYLEKIADLSIDHQDELTNVKLRWGYHQGFFNSLNGLLRVEHKLDSHQNIVFTLGLNQRSTLGTFMLIAGSEDEYRFQYRHQWTARDLLITTLEFNNYQLQDRTQLGSSQIVRFGLDHQFYFDYPDIGISWNTDIDRFKRYHSYLGSPINAIFPNNTTATVSAFIPDDFWQTALSLNIGTSVNANYSSAFRPYLSAGLIYNQTASYGWDASGGINGRLFGRDQLKLYYTRSSVTGGQTQTNFMVGLSYDIFL
jgi:hypothetical protein